MRIIIPEIPGLRKISNGRETPGKKIFENWIYLASGLSDGIGVERAILETKDARGAP